MKSIKIISLMVAAMIIAACSTSDLSDIVSNSNDNNHIGLVSQIHILTQNYSIHYRLRLF